MTASLLVPQGEAVELTLIQKLDAPHGLQIAAAGSAEGVQAQAQLTVQCTAAQPGAPSSLCPLHPPQLGGQLLVWSTEGHAGTSAAGWGRRRRSWRG